MAQLEDGNGKVTNSVIPNGTEAKVMRNLIENKGLLNGKGKLYAGTDDTTSTGAPVTTAIDPSGAVDGSVLIKDSTKDGGWTVGQVGTAGIAAGAITSEQTHFEDKITIYPSNPTSGPQPTVISLPFAPVGSSQQVNLKLPSSSGQLINQDYVDDQKFASQIAKTTLAYGQYSTPNMALEYGQSVTFTVIIIGATHENGGDTSGIIGSVTMGTPPYSDSAIWLRGGRVVSYTDTTVTLSFTNRDSSTVYQVPWGINVDYGQPAYMAQIAQTTDFSNTEWTRIDGEDKASVVEGGVYQIRTEANNYYYVEGIVTMKKPTTQSLSTVCLGVHFRRSGSSVLLIDEYVVEFNHSKGTMSMSEITTNVNLSASSITLVGSYPPTTYWEYRRIR